MKKLLAAATALAFALELGACSVWVGNPGPKPKPKGDDDDGGKGGSGVSPTGGGGGVDPTKSEEPGVKTGTATGTDPVTAASNLAAAIKQLVAGPGDVLLRKVHLQGGMPFSSTVQLKAGAALLDVVSKVAPIELSIDNPDGTEAAYTRAAAGDVVVAFTPPTDGDYTFTLKNNSSASQTVIGDSTVGAATASALINATTDGASPFKTISLKAVVAFAKQCLRYKPDGSAVDTFTAPGNTYYAEPFVFLGRVGADGKVTPINTATIELKSGATSQTLTRIGAFGPTVIQDNPHLDAADQITSTRAQYQGYFGAAGEMYTVDTFRFWGDCLNAPTFDLGTDPGKVDIRLTVDDPSQSPPISASFKIQATGQGLFDMKLASGAAVDNSTVCVYDAVTGKATIYYNPGAPCVPYSATNPPYVTNYVTPSSFNAGMTAASNPTRVTFYGYGTTHELYAKELQNSAALIAGTMTSLDVSGCMNVGGLVSTPLGAANTYLPLTEFNSVTGDVVQLAFRGSSYTALTDYYQGNIQIGGSNRVLVCVPGAGSCQYKMINVNSSSCSVKSDSGISVLSVDTSFVYPEMYKLGGVQAD